MTSLMKSAIAVFTLGAASVAAFHPAQAKSSPPVLNETAAKESGILRTSVGDYQFTTATCGIYKEDGVDDIEIGGPGVAPDGEKLYFEFSSTANEMSVHLGVDAPRTSADRMLRAGRYVSKEFAVTVTDRIVSVPSLVLIDENGQTIDNDANLTINCGR